MPKAKPARERDIPKFLPWALNSVTDDAAMFGADGAAPAFYERGREGSRLVVLTGSNASGKSLLVRFLGSRAADYFKDDPRGVERLIIGMLTRSQGGFMRAFVYGSESDDSTGQISVKAVNGLISNAPNRKRVFLAALDEPDIGLSEDYAQAMGDKVAAFATDLPPLCAALVVVSHSRALISRLMGLEPHAFRMGDSTPTAEWIANGVQAKSVADLDGIADDSLARYRAIHGVQKARGGD